MPLQICSLSHNEPRPALGTHSNNHNKKRPGVNRAARVKHARLPLGDLEQAPILLATAAHRKADSAEAEQHHRPRRRLGHSSHARFSDAKLLEAAETIRGIDRDARDCFACSGENAKAIVAVICGGVRCGRARHYAVQERLDQDCEVLVAKIDQVELGLANTAAKDRERQIVQDAVRSSNRRLTARIEVQACCLSGCKVQRGARGHNLSHSRRLTWPTHTIRSRKVHVVRIADAG